MKLTACESCGVGSSATECEVPAQVKVYGEYICKKCEAAFESILESHDEIYIKNGHGTSEAIITTDHIYYFEVRSSKVKNPSSSFLGFAGRWFLITQDCKTDWGFKRKAYVTNNLFHNRTIPKSFRQKIIDSGKVNATVIEIAKSELITLKNELNRIPYLKENGVNM